MGKCPFLWRVVGWGHIDEFDLATALAVVTGADHGR